MTADRIRHVHETDVFGPVRVTHAFLPLPPAATVPSVIDVTSGLGSFTLTHDPERVESPYPLAAHGSSKSAVTMPTTQSARTIPDVRFDAVDPGRMHRPHRTQCRGGRRGSGAHRHPGA